jgi:hypothetical protein
MAFTRFHDDPCRVQKQLQETTDIGRYIMNVPGNGENPYYVNDPHIRMQKWGANLMTNSINLESDLFGLSRNLNKDCTDVNQYNLKNPKGNTISCPTIKTITDQSRSTHPAWLYKDLEQNNFKILHLNPQENACIPFNYNLNTRSIEKDSYVPNYNCLSNNNMSYNMNNTPLYTNTNFANNTFNNA